MKITLRAPIVLSFRSPITREGVFFIVATIRSAVISCFVFVAWVYPLYYLQWLRGPLVAIARVLSIPIRALGQLIPALASPIFGAGEIGDLWPLFWRHMVVGVVAYLLVFHIPVVVRFLRSRLGRDASAPA